MNIKFVILLATFVCYGQSHIIAPNEIDTREVDQEKVDEWVRNFYDKCGQTENVDRVGAPAREGTELVKRCVGDRDNCIEEKNCYFAVAITESATYRRVIVGPSTTQSTEEKYERILIDHNVKVLDTCHFNSLPNDETQLPEKFVGVGLATFFPGNSLLDCERDPTFEDFKTFFFVSNFSACNIQTTLPLYPYLGTGSPTSTILNEFTLRSSDWKSSCRSAINNGLPADLDKGNIQHFLQNFLVHYYGTKRYTNLNDFSYTMPANFAQVKDNVYLAPATNRTIPVPEKPNGSPVFQPSIFVSTTILLSIVKLFC